MPHIAFLSLRQLLYIYSFHAYPAVECGMAYDNSAARYAAACTERGRFRRVSVDGADKGLLYRW